MTGLYILWELLLLLLREREKKRRKKLGKPKGRVDFNLCYVYEPNAEQIQHMADNLDEKEYNTEFGVKAYSRSDIEDFFADNSQPVNRQVLLDYYDQVFSL